MININLSDTLTWKQNFGLLPIHLKPAVEGTFVLLNGGHGDFCLQTINDDSELEQYYSKSWSSNTKNYVVLDKYKVKIFNWTRKPEEVALNQVTDNVEKFYKYLVSRSYKSEKDIVPFIIDIFRQFRNLTQERTNPIEALNLLFVLLTSIEDDLNQLDRQKWNLENINIPDNFDFYTEKIKGGVGAIKPELDLILRHSAGILFQEAQKEVLFFNPQRDLFGGISSFQETKINLYSSIHYTPPYLARTIVENSIRKLNLAQDIKIFDPACGSSEFLIEVLKQLKECDYKGIITMVGWDSSQTAVNTSNFLLKYEQRTIWGNNLNFEIKLVEDSLLENWDNDYNLILMNPPFVSWELLKSKSDKDAVQNTLGKVFNGKPNQASAFFYKSIQCLDADGVIGCVIPSSLLSLDAYQKLRKDAYDLLTISLIGKLGNFVFEDALTDVSLLVGHKPKEFLIPTVLWAKNEKGIAQDALRDLRKMHYSNTNTVDEKNYSIYQPVDFPIIKESWKPISLSENELYKNIERFVLEKQLSRIDDIFNVQQGIRTGNNNLFKISKREFELLPEQEQYYFRPVGDNESIKNGALFTHNYIWYPYNENGLIIKSETEFSQSAPIFYEKLVIHRPKLSERARKDINSWWHLSEHRAWLRTKNPRLISSEFGKSDSFAFDKTGEYAVERGNAWLPKKEFIISDNYFYLALFSSPLFDKLLSIYSKQLLSGWDLGKKYTKEIPIPNVHLDEVRNSAGYENLVMIGKELENGSSYMKSLIDEILYKHYYPQV